MLERWRPKRIVKSIYDIDLERLRQDGIRGIIADLDNTLVGAGTANAPPALIRWLEKVKSMGFQLVIVSNNHELRVSNFARPLNLLYISRARKPLAPAFRRALSLMKLNSHQAVVVGDQLLTDVFGGNRVGLATILVVPISPSEESRATRFNRRIERLIMARLRQSGRWQEEGQRHDNRS